MNEQSLTTILRKLGITEFKRTRRGWVDFHCPLARYTHRSGTDRSMSAGAKIVNDGLSAWVCHACKHHGRITHLITKVQQFSGQIVPGLLREAEMAEVLPALTTEYGEFEGRVAEPEPEPLDDAVVDDLYPHAAMVNDARVYLDRRGVSQAVANLLGLLYDDEQRRILFPVRDRAGALWGFTGRAIDPDTKPKIRDYYGLPKRRLILGEHLWKPGRPLLIVEGLFGYAHLMGLGLSEVNVGALLGSVVTPEKAAILREWDENTYLLLDNDDGGDAGLFGPLLPDGLREHDKGAVALLQGYVPVYVPEWPEGKDDPDQLTADEVRQMLAETSLYSS